MSQLGLTLMLVTQQLEAQAYSDAQKPFPPGRYTQN